MATAGSEMAFHFGGEAHPPPTHRRLLSAPFLWPVAPLSTGQRAFYLAASAAGQESSPPPGRDLNPPLVGPPNATWQRGALGY